MSNVMRAKMRVTEIKQHPTCDVVKLNGVGPKGSYPDDGSDEDNTYAKFSPQAELTITIANPALLGEIKRDDIFYVDFKRVPKISDG